MLFPLLGFFFISLLGTLSHFMYDWTNHSKIGSILFAVNESTWEHIKIALTPAFIWTLIELPFYMSNNNFVLAVLIEIISLIIIIPTLFYGYKLITKKSILFLDISIFYIAIIVSQILFYIITNSSSVNTLTTYISFIILILLFSFYLLFTIYPLNNIIFKDPITKKYGIKAHK